MLLAELSFVTVTTYIISSPTTYYILFALEIVFVTQAYT